MQLQAGRGGEIMERGVRPRAGRSVVAQEDNRMLDKIRVGINQAYRKIADRDNYVTAEKVRNAYLGLGMNHETLLAVFRQHNEDYEKQVGKLKSLRSYWKYCTVYNHLTEFAGNQSGGLCDQSGPRPAAAACGAAACVMAGWILPVHFQKRISSNIRSSSLCQRGFPFFQIMYRLIVEPVNALYHGRADSSKM